MFKKTIGIAMTVIGFMGSIVGIIALIDPVGTQMADDTNSFGTPPPTSQTVVMLISCLIILAMGIWILRKK